MKAVRYWWWLISGLVVKHRKVIVYAMFLSMLVMSFIPRLLPLLNRFHPSSTIGIVGRFKPSELPTSITRRISKGLTAINDQGEAVPDIATGWTVSDDGKTYSFSLNPAQKWQDGTPVQSSDIRYGIENVTTAAPDPQTLVFSLKEPFAPFPTVLSRPMFKDRMIGVGELTVKSMKKNGEFIDQLTLSGAGNQRTTYRFYRSTQDAITALKLGEVNTIQDLTNSRDIPNWKELQIVPKLNADRYIAVFFNTKDENLTEKSFRQALAYAIPNKSVGEERALSPMSTHSWSYNPQVKPYNTDVSQAKELLKSIYTDKEPPRIELTTFSPYIDRADNIAKAWTDVGVKTEVKIVTTIPDNFQALLIGQQIPPDPDQYFLWHSTQNTNITHYASPKVDKLLEDGRKTLDQKKRIEIYQDFQRFLLEDAPATFLEHITTYTVTRK